VDDLALIGDDDFDCGHEFPCIFGSGLPGDFRILSGCRIRCRCKLIRKETTSGNLAGTGIAVASLDYSITRDPPP